MKADIRIADDVRDVLNRAVVDGNILKLAGQLDRDLYTRTNKALEALGGTWNRGKKGHVFAGDPRAAIAAAAEDGKVAHPNQLDFFPTSRNVAEIACRRLGMGDTWKRTLEPSAGEADLIAPLVDWLGKPTAEQLFMVEKDPRRIDVLKADGYSAHTSAADFLALDPIAFRPFDRIIMNPPFERGSDAKHIAHALEFLAPGGRLVAIASGAFKTRDDKAGRAIRGRLASWGVGIDIDDLPDGSFKHAGTSVATVLVTVDRPAA